MTWLFVALGGAIGASLRYAVSLMFLKPVIGFPWATWSVNFIGCLCAGIFFALSQKFPSLQHEAHLFLMVGILGGFTTFSSFGLETFQLLKQQEILLAVYYVGSSILLGICALAAAYYGMAYILASR